MGFGTPKTTRTADEIQAGSEARSDPQLSATGMGPGAAGRVSCFANTAPFILQVQLCSGGTHNTFLSTWASGR